LHNKEDKSRTEVSRSQDDTPQLVTHDNLSRRTIERTTNTWTKYWSDWRVFER